MEIIENCKKSYDFIEPPLIFPDNSIQQSGPKGLYFDWVGLCKDGTLTFGRETGDKSEIILSCELYPDGSEELVYHEKPDVKEYWKYAEKNLTVMRYKNPQLYAKVLDLLDRNGLGGKL